MISKEQMKDIWKCQKEDSHPKTVLKSIMEELIRLKFHLLGKVLFFFIAKIEAGFTGGVITGLKEVNFFEFARLGAYDKKKFLIGGPFH